MTSHRYGKFPRRQIFFTILESLQSFSRHHFGRIHNCSKINSFLMCVDVSVYEFVDMQSFAMFAKFAVFIDTFLDFLDFFDLQEKFSTSSVQFVNV